MAVLALRLAIDHKVSHVRMCDGALGFPAGTPLTQRSGGIALPARVASRRVMLADGRAAPRGVAGPAWQKRLRLQVPPSAVRSLAAALRARDRPGGLSFSLLHARRHRVLWSWTWPSRERPGRARLCCRDYAGRVSGTSRAAAPGRSASCGVAQVHLPGRCGPARQAELWKRTGNPVNKRRKS
jgi:hypothetical protein